MNTRVFAVLALVPIIACNSDSAIGPNGSGESLQFSERITLPQFGDQLATGPTRVEIKLMNGTLLAREVEVEEPDDRFDEEEIESRVTAVTLGQGGSDGTLTLAIGSLEVGFTSATRFEDEDGTHLTLQEFVARVEDALQQGRSPAIEAKRPPPATVQAPDDATFIATKLELDDEADENEIEITIDDRHLSLNASPPPDAVLTVLNLPIELDVTGGRTRLESEIDDDRAEVEFEGMVSSVVGRTVTLGDGVIVELVADTEIEESDDADELGSLAEVERALGAGLAVEAEGEGVLVATNPRTIVAREIEFEVE